MRWLMMSHLIKIYTLFRPVFEFSVWYSWTVRLITFWKFADENFVLCFLVVNRLNFETYCKQKHFFFWRKMWGAFAAQKLFLFFPQKAFLISCLLWDLTSLCWMTLLMMFWRNGPDGTDYSLSALLGGIYLLFSSLYYEFSLPLFSAVFYCTKKKIHYYYQIIYQESLSSNLWWELTLYWK